MFYVLIEVRSNMVVTRDWGDKGVGKDKKRLINGYYNILREE
jgi:hypothetical protein